MSSSVSEPEVLEMGELPSEPKPVSPEVMPIFEERSREQLKSPVLAEETFEALINKTLQKYFRKGEIPDRKILISIARPYVLDEDAANHIVDEQITRFLEKKLSYLSDHPTQKNIEYAHKLYRLIEDKEQVRIKRLQAELKAMLAALNGAGVSKSFDDSNSDKEIYGEEWQSEALEAAVKDTFLEGCLTLIEGTFKRDDAGKLRYDLQYNDPIGNRAIFQYREDEDGAYLTLKSGASAQQIRAFVETIPIAFEDFIDPARATAFAFCQDQILKGLDKKTLKTIFDGMPRVTIWFESGFDQAFYENRIRQLLSHGILPELRESCQCKELADAHKAVLMTDGEWDLQEICKYYIDMSKAFIKALEAQSSENDEIPMDFKQKHEMLMKEIEALGEHSDIQGGLDISPAPAPL